MAKIIVENALVERVFWEGKAASVSERFTVQGQKVSRYWTLWFDQPHGLPEGAVISVQGLFSDKPETYPKKDGTTGVSSNLAINKPQILNVESDKVGIAAANEVWPTVTPGGAVDESAPF